MASEFAKQGKKRGSLKRNALISPFLALYASASFALPSGNELVAGQASITAPAAGQLQINQSSQQAIINWQGFSIGAHESVNIQQPNASAVQLDRVIGQDASNIQGQLNANGQVFLINPNGVIFSKTAQVDVGGLIASTHSISNADFLNGKLHFTQDNAQGSVINQGRINTPKGGIVALIGEQVQNSGAISTPEGATVLAAGKTIDLDIQGNGLVEVKISEAAYNAQINNNGIIQADGGQVILTAQAAGQLLNTVINNQGVIEARGLVEKNGAIVLSGGDNGIVQAGGVLDVSGQAGAQTGGSALQGGSITVSGAQIQVGSNAILNASGDAGGGSIAIGDKQSTSQAGIAAGASLTAQALDHGKAGSIAVLANMANGAVKVEGQLNASAPKQGDGGSIETSAAHVKIADSAQISTRAANGKSGSWIIDPADFTIAASGGDITGAALSASLTNTGVTIYSTNGSNGDINVNDVVSWSANPLTLNAQRNININAVMTATGSASLAMNPSSANGVNVALSGSGFTGRVDFSGRGALSIFNNFYTVINSLGAPGSSTGADLQGMGTSGFNYYALGANIDATSTNTWNGGAGFVPVGNSLNPFTGYFNGLGHTISGLFVNNGLVNGDAGLFGAIDTTASISNVGLLNANITGLNYAGALVGESIAGGTSSISNSYATGSVNTTGVSGGGILVSAGGLIGRSFTDISNSYASVNVLSPSATWVGGLVGEQQRNIDNSYATGNVSGLAAGGLVGYLCNCSGVSGINNSYATGNVNDSGNNGGGLVGFTYNGAITNSYATGAVSGAGTGGLLGGSLNGVSIGNSFWNIQTSGQATSVGGTGLTNAQMMQLGSFAGWNISGAGGSGAVWRIYDGHTAPLLTSFLTGLTLTDVSVTYNGFVQSGASVANSVAASGLNAGLYSPYSTQQGYDITGGNLTITPATLTYVAALTSIPYGTSNPILPGTVTGFVGADTLASATTGSAGFSTSALSTSNVGSYTITGSGLTANNGNYTFTQAESNATALSITPASLIITANSFSKNDDGLAYTGGNGVTYSGLVNNETNSVLSGTLTYGGDSQGAITTGNYAIIPGGLSSGNYNISYHNGLLSIGNAAIARLPVQIYPPISVPPVVPVSTASSPETSSASSSTNSTVHDVTNSFTGNNILPAMYSEPLKKRKMIQPTLKIRNSAGRIKQIQMDANKQYLSLLLDDGEVRVWDFQAGLQRQITTGNTRQTLTAISPVNDKGESLAVAGTTGIGTYDLVGSILDDQLSISRLDAQHFITSRDGNLLLVNTGDNELSLWDNKQAGKRWDLAYQRGRVNGLDMTDNQRYGAVLSRQPDTYVLPSNLQLQAVTDAVDIVDLGKGQVIKSLPNLGEQIVYMRFKNNDTLQLGLASGELLDWPIATDNHLTPVANFAEPVTAVDAAKDTYAYLLNDGTVRVGNGQGKILLSIQNEKNPFKDAMLLAGDKKLLTVMANGELSVWDVATGVKMLRLFSTKQGWTAMDAFGRFDGSEEALENFTWAANEEDIPLDSFSENYYEPGLVASVLHNQNYLNSNPMMVQDGITLPPKVVLQMAGQQTNSDKAAVQLDVYDRGGGIDNIHIYQNGKLLNNKDVIAAQQVLQNDKAEHRVLKLNVTPSAGKNILKVIASNDMGIENGSTELSFDGTTKAAASAIRMLTIGIDKYSDSSLNLDYSVADANAIGQALTKSSKIASSKSLYNENATKPKILAELKEVSRGDQQDTLIIYFAGHGIALGKEWYFLPYETKMQPSVEKIAAAGITATELREIFKDTKMQHILVMIDSCYSGAATDSFNKLQIGQHYVTRNLSRSLGITMITSAAKDKEAYELKSLGHGLFTYLMAQDIQNNKANHSAHGIAENIVKTLPAFSKKMVGASQESVIYTKGNDFMLTD
ncbi:MAG: filamentous hemagglutinin N-terminal domain-containing protein [Methylococcales bacterium]|nr:filamentous hemagglutinin N-terminal domain-containing protein [Methylococcales bacterium]